MGTKSFGNEMPCNECSEGPTRLFYGEDEEGADDIWLCENCFERYCPKCNRLFDSKNGYKAHKGKMHS